MKNFDLIKLPFSKNNPILVQVLGVCSCLAVTAQLKPAVVMARCSATPSRRASASSCSSSWFQRSWCWSTRC